MKFSLCFLLFAFFIVLQTSQAAPRGGGRGGGGGGRSGSFGSGSKGSGAKSGSSRAGVFMVGGYGVHAAAARSNSDKSRTSKTLPAWAIILIVISSVGVAYGAYYALSLYGVLWCKSSSSDETSTESTEEMLRNGIKPPKNPEANGNIPEMLNNELPAKSGGSEVFM